MSALVVQEIADVDRAIVQLFTRWTLQRMEIRVDALPSLVVQRAQHHISQTFERCNCVLGEMLAALTLMGGAGYVWTMSLGWPAMVPVALVALYAGLIGKGIEVAWTRLRMLRILKGLRHRLAGEHGEAQAEYARSDAAVYQGRKPPGIHAADFAPSYVAAHSVAATHAVVTTPAREQLLLRNSADVKRMILHLFTRWRLPRAEVHINGLSALETQRSQHRLTSLASRCNCTLGSVLAAAILLGGSFYVVMSSSYHWVWTSGRSWDWQPLGWVVFSALGAALAGWMIEALWTRASMLRILSSLQRSKQ